MGQPVRGGRHGVAHALHDVSADGLAVACRAMRAVVIEAFGQVPRVADVPDPAPDTARARRQGPSAAFICDVGPWRGHQPRVHDRRAPQAGGVDDDRIARQRCRPADRPNLPPAVRPARFGLRDTRGRLVDRHRLRRARAAELGRRPRPRPGRLALAGARPAVPAPRRRRQPPQRRPRRAGRRRLHPGRDRYGPAARADADRARARTPDHARRGLRGPPPLRRDPRVPRCGGARAPRADRRGDRGRGRDQGPPGWRAVPGPGRLRRGRARRHGGPPDPARDRRRRSGSDAAGGRCRPEVCGSFWPCSGRPG